MNQAREDKVAATRARMAELAAKFIERSAGELQTLRARFANLQAGDLEALGDIRHLAHRMCGTGATLGFEALADEAARVEKQAEPAAAGKPPDTAALAQLAAGIEALGVELARLDAAGKLPAGP